MGGRTSPNFALTAGGIRRPHRLRFAPAVRECVVVIRQPPQRFDRKHMIKNLRIPRYKPIIPDSEISDGTTPVYADSEARLKRFLQKRNFSDRADKILYFPSLTFGREDSDASRRFGTWGIEIYNQIMRLSILRVKTPAQIRKQGGGRRITWRSRRAAFAALTRDLTPAGRGCGNAWSLYAMTALMGSRHRVGRNFRFFV